MLPTRRSISKIQKLTPKRQGLRNKNVTIFKKFLMQVILTLTGLNTQTQLIATRSGRINLTHVLKMLDGGWTISLPQKT